MLDFIYSSSSPRYFSSSYSETLAHIPSFVIEKLSGGNLAQIMSREPNFGQF